VSESLEVLSSRIRDFVTGRGHDSNLVAAAQFCADSDTILRKVAGFVDSDGWIEWQQLADRVDVSGWSSGEKAAIRLACSLAGYTPDDATKIPDGWLLANMLAPLDSGLRRLAVEAVRYAIDGPEGTR
jgi:hypothetical protein